MHPRTSHCSTEFAPILRGLPPNIHVLTKQSSSDITNDLVEADDLIEFNGTKGKVVKIGLRNIWVKTVEGNLVIISNSQIANGPLINYTVGERLLKKL
ncbi:MAG: mechanosensitive ion channel domain-containing protein [Candidatus Bathyarchaeia archaeon]